MNTIISQIALLSCFAFVNVVAKTFYRYIPEQEVKSNGEIYWYKPANLQGNYDVKLVIFPEHELHEGEIVLFVGEPFLNMKNSTVSIDTIDEFSVFLLDTSLRIRPEDDIIIYFTGNQSLSIKRSPQSYVMLTKIVIRQTVTEKTTTIRLSEQSAKTNEWECLCVIEDTELKLLIVLSVITTGLVVLNIIIYIRLSKYLEMSPKRA